MELALKPSSKNNHEIGGILIKSTSPKVWLQELQNMGLTLSSVKAYAVPSDKANVLYGCLIVAENRKVDTIGKNSYLQLVDKKIFIPEYATLAPAVATNEWEALFSDCLGLFLPEIGLFELKETINWSNLTAPVKEQTCRIEVPAKSVQIPKLIKSHHVEYDEEELMKDIMNPLSEEEMIDKLPFDMKKLLNGNQKEMEKYLEFMEKHPEMALKYALPLDNIGSSRGNNMGRFTFGGDSLFDNFFGLRNPDDGLLYKSVLKSKGVMSLLFVFIAFLMLSFIFSKSNQDVEVAETTKIDTTTSTSVGTRSNKDKIVSTQTTSPSVNDSSKRESASTNQIIVAAFCLVMLLLFMKLVFTSSLSLFFIQNFRGTIVLLVLLGISVLILVLPIYESNGFDGIFSTVILIIVGSLLYRVFNSNATLLKK